MHALQTTEPTPNYRRPKPKRRRSRQRRSRFHQELATEIKLKLAANALLSVAAIAALLKLLPYQLTQQAKLQEVRSEVQEVAMRVEKLRSNFSRSFDPHQTKKIMQEQTPWLDPNQRRIFLVQP
jgi:hypothetical protein